MRTLLLFKERDRGQGYRRHRVRAVVGTKLHFKDRKKSFSLEGHSSASGMRSEFEGQRGARDQAEPA